MPLTVNHSTAADGTFSTEGAAAWNAEHSIAGSVAWGEINGTLSNQTDLQTALNAKANSSSLATVAITGAYADLTGKPTLGTAAATAATDYATAAQGAAADSALQPNGNGSGLTGLTKGQVGLGNVDNTSDANKPVSTATQTALDLKANLASPTFTGTVTLPAGQVVNGVTLTTAGGTTNFLRADGTYAAPTASAVWGGITGTLSSQTDLQNALNAKVTDADVRGGAANLNARLGTISNFSSPNAGGVVVGQYYDNSFQGTASATLAGAANRIDLAPYYTSVPLTIDRIGCSVSTGVTGANIKIVIYSSDANGWPDALLYESGDLSAASSGAMAEATLSFSFSSGVQYWVGVRHSSTATLRTINVSSAVNLGLTSSTASNYATILRRTVTFANAAPNPWVFTNSDRVANVTPPSIRFRAA